MNNLLGHLALRLGTQQELWATESLHFILRSSAEARDAFLNYVGELTQVVLPQDLWFRTQVAAKDGAIPDLIGVDDQSRVALVVEAKFWAGLTDNQPVAYLRQIAGESPGVLLFIAPASRLETLWPEVLGRCREAGMALEPVAAPGEASAAQVAGSTLALCSWSALLAYITMRLEMAGELAAANDVSQLVGLCAQMDRTAFHPVRSEELAPEIGRRNAQYCDLADELTVRLRQEKFISLKGFKATGTKYWYGRYMSAHGHQILLKCDHALWSNAFETPLWLHIWPKGDTRQRLTPLMMEVPPRLIERNGELLVPLMIPLGVEYAAVFASLLAQIKDVLEVLKPPVAHT
jgi:hypothetical protein